MFTVSLRVRIWIRLNFKTHSSEHQGHVFSYLIRSLRLPFNWGLRYCIRLIGPRRIFLPGHLYYVLTSFFLIGAVTPVIPWLITRRYPNSFKYVNFPVIYSFILVLVSSYQPPLSTMPLGDCRFHLSVCHPKEALLMVEQVQLVRPFCRPRLWCRLWNYNLLRAVRLAWIMCWLGGEMLGPLTTPMANLHRYWQLRQEWHSVLPSGKYWMI
jgi:hypothetical protein